jgi:16S rRNA (cytosine1402-N4)-methyltransferase
MPVMLDEVLDALDLAPGKCVADCTLGGAGHSQKIAEILGESGLLIGIDQDSDAIAEATKALSKVNGAKFYIANMRFDQIADAIAEAGVDFVDGVLFDLGVSSWQLDESSRGFTFRDSDSPLDMRMNQNSEGDTAADLLNNWDEASLTKIFRDYSDERWALRIAKFILERRKTEPYVNAGQLIETINAAVPAAARAADSIHPATRVFQALRIAVNNEFDVLKTALSEAVKVLSPGGRLVTIEYHSGEARIIKQFMAQESGKGGCKCPPRQPICTCGADKPGVLEIVTKKPISPSESEILRNPRSRSAKLRIAQKR